MPLNIPNVQNVQFAAHLIGAANIPRSNAHADSSAAPIAARLVMLDANDGEDTAFLKRAMDTVTPNLRKYAPKGKHVQPWLSEDLTKGVFKQPYTFFEKANNGQATQAPKVIAALDDANRLLGLTVGHLERRLSNGKKVYTPLKIDVDGDAGDGSVEQTGHTSFNWTVSFLPTHKVGKALKVAFINSLPAAIKRIDTVTSVSENSARTGPLNEQFGLKPRPDLVNDTFIPTEPTDSTYSFAEMPAMPMSGTRQDVDEQTKAIAQSINYTAQDGEQDVSMTPVTLIEQT